MINEDEDTVDPNAVLDAVAADESYSGAIDSAATEAADDLVIVDEGLGDKEESGEIVEATVGEDRAGDVAVETEDATAEDTASAEDDPAADSTQEGSGGTGRAVSLKVHTQRSGG